MLNIFVSVYCGTACAAKLNIAPVALSCVTILTAHVPVAHVEAALSCVTILTAHVAPVHVSAAEVHAAEAAHASAAFFVYLTCYIDTFFVIEEVIGIGNE